MVPKCSLCLISFLDPDPRAGICQVLRNQGVNPKTVQAWEVRDFHLLPVVLEQSLVAPASRVPGLPGVVSTGEDDLFSLQRFPSFCDP